MFRIKRSRLKSRPWQLDELDFSDNSWHTYGFFATRREAKAVQQALTALAFEDV